MISRNSLDLTKWPEALASQYKELGYWQDKTLCDHFNQSVRKWSNKTALICGERQFSYQKTADKISRLASGFTSLGLAKGDNVVLQMTNIAEFYFCYFALLQKGIRPVLALPAHRFSEISYFCRHADAKAYIIDGEQTSFDYQALAQQVLAENNALQHVIVRTSITGLKDAKFQGLDSLLEKPDS